MYTPGNLTVLATKKGAYWGNDTRVSADNSTTGTAADTPITVAATTAATAAAADAATWKTRSALAASVNLTLDMPTASALFPACTSGLPYIAFGRIVTHIIVVSHTDSKRNSPAQRQYFGGNVSCCADCADPRVRTRGDAAPLQVDDTPLAADGQDVAILTVTVPSL